MSFTLNMYVMTHTDSFGRETVRSFDSKNQLMWAVSNKIQATSKHEVHPEWIYLIDDNGDATFDYEGFWGPESVSISIIE